MIHLLKRVATRWRVRAGVALLLPALAAAACGSDPAAPVPAGLRVYLGDAGTPQAISLVPGARVPLTARLVGADGAPLGGPLTARWAAREAGIVDVRDTVFAGPGGTVPGVMVTGRGSGSTVLQASVDVGGRTLRGELPVLGTLPATR